MNMQTRTAVVNTITPVPTQSAVLQRACACGNHTQGGGECESCKKGRLQRSPGRPLDDEALAVMKPEFGRDFSQVKPYSNTRLANSKFVPVRPSSSLQLKHPAPSSQPAERQADLMGAQIGRILESTTMAPGPISQAVRATAEPILGIPLEGVYLDVGSSAHARTTSEHALAMTEGTHVSFANGQFMPTTSPGRAIIGHELTHVAQQRAHGQTTVQHFGLALNFERLARQIEDAVSGLGTDEEAIYRALTMLQRDPDSVTELEMTYTRLFSETLMQALEGDLNQEELDYAKGLMGMAVTAGSNQRIETPTPTSPAQWDALAQRIKAAVDYGTLGGTDEEAIFAVLQPLAGDANKIAEIKRAYARVTGGSGTALVDAINDEMSGSQLSYALQLLAVPDPHAGTQAELSRDQVLAIRNELNPGSAVAPPPPPPPGGAPPPLPPPARWDGRTGAANEAVNRAALQSDLTTDLTNHLTRVMPGINAAAADPQLPVANLEGAANAAVEVTDDEFRSWYGVAATTPGQAALRSGFRFSQAAGNLRDATDPVARAAVGNPLSAASVANWMVEHDDPPAPPGAVEHMAAHSFNPDRRPDTDGERIWLQTNVINPFISPAARNSELRLYDQFGFAFQPEPGKILLPTTVAGSSLASGGAPNIADRRFLWSTWHIAVHEYLHNLAHPAFEESLSENNEGFTEYFTKGVITRAAPVAHQNSGLVQQVEGGVFAPPTTPALVGAYTTPPTYAADLAHVEAVRATVPGGDSALRAAYFQGHTEMLGIDPATQDFVTAPPAAVNPTLVNLPAGIANLDDLAARSRVPVSEILAANSGLTRIGPVPPRLILPGGREHRVVTTFASAGVAGPAETIEQISAQNGVSIESLRRANPSALWATLAAGQMILIPRH